MFVESGVDDRELKRLIPMLLEPQIMSNWTRRTFLGALFDVKAAKARHSDEDD